MSRIELHGEPGAAFDALEGFAASAAFHRFYWERPARGEARLALGAAEAIEAAGEGAPAAVHEGSAALWERVAVRDPVPGFAPFLVGGAAFDPAASSPARAGWAGFPGARLVLPAHGWVVRDGRSVAFRVAGAAAPEPARRPLPSEDPPAFRVVADQSLARWRERAAAARDAVADGRFEKLVLARSVRVVASSPVDAFALLAALRERHPGCTLFAVGVGPTVFLGATPEDLVEVDPDGRVRASALAGSAPRGRTPEQDHALGRVLRESKKEQEEHAVVVRALGRALGAVCAELRAPESPTLLRTDGIQHLHTAFEGRLAEPGRPGVLELVARLHPSPAVCGAPRAEALRWLRSHEGLARGWYAGPVGWAGAHGEGAFAVALRSARLTGEAVDLFAGAGIMAASDPEGELRETRLKLRAVLGPLLEI